MYRKHRCILASSLYLLTSIPLLAIDFTQIQAKEWSATNCSPHFARTIATTCITYFYKKNTSAVARTCYSSKNDQCISFDLIDVEQNFRCKRLPNVPETNTVIFHICPFNISWQDDIDDLISLLVSIHDLALLFIQKNSYYYGSFDLNRLCKS